MTQGSEATNCDWGTPSSNSFETTFEKLWPMHQRLVSLQQDKRRNALLEPEVLVLSVCLGVLLELLVLGERVVRSAFRVDYDQRSCIETGGLAVTYGSIIRERDFLSWSCLGPSHLRQTHFSSKRRR